MFSTVIPGERKIALRHKARLNICLARDLADSFGGSKADYLKRLNQNLRLRITVHSDRPIKCLARAD